MTQPATLPAASGKSLFSRHFLENHLPAWPEWAADPAPAYAQVAALWARGLALGLTWNEAQTEDEFIKPALAALGWAVIPQVRATTAARLARPDYALFQDTAAKNAAYLLQNAEAAFYDRAAAIAEAKHWGRPLSRRDPDGREVWDRQSNPSHQMVSYLTGTRCAWGILTNGPVWRLYSREVNSTASEFYEIDLAAIFALPADAQPAAFKLWWLFFRREAFAPDASGRNFVRRVMEGSATYARRVSDQLKDLVYREVMPELAAGFIAYRREQRGVAAETADSLAEIYRASLSLLYKLLFILYAEARGLLPVDNPAYRADSLTRMAQEFADKHDRHLPLSEETHAAPRYDALRGLFNRIDRGDRALGVPRYDGGLFNPTTPENRFLDAHRLSDCAVARVVDLLVRDAGEPVDYGYISVRNLGSIYEGLLENRLALTEDDGAPRVALVNDRGERKATGSYYTPDYIVKYIVAETLGPVLIDRGAQFERAMDRIAALRGQLARTAHAGTVGVLREQLAAAEAQGREAFLGIKVCDPAMGSGHFLVDAVDFLTDGIIQRMQQYHAEHPAVSWEWNPLQQLVEQVRREIIAEMARQGITLDARRLDDTRLLTRLVMKRCVYGVDLNRMAVELAKLSLWLHSFTVGAPLSFLDHHLRWGNSLIGSDVRSMEAAIAVADTGQLALWSGPFAGLLELTSTMLAVAGRADSTLADVRQSADEFAALQASLTPYKQALDLWVSRHFGNTWATGMLTLHAADVVAALRGEGRLDAQQRATLDTARQLWEEKRFFHWDLEFPEVFVDLARRDWAENPGFDAVIGNPPYDVLAEKERREDLTALLRYFEADENLKPALGGKLDLYRLFTVRMAQQTAKGGYVGAIVPMSILADQQTIGVRRFLLANTKLLTIEAFPQKDDPLRRVFREAKLPTCVIVARNLETGSNDFSVVVHPGNQLDEVSGKFSWSGADAEVLDENFMPIPLLASDATANLLRRLYIGSDMQKLGQVCPTYQGEINETTMAPMLSADPNAGPRVLRGGNVQRYELIPEPKQGEPKHLKLDMYRSAISGERSRHTLMERIGYQRNAALDNWRRLIVGPLPKPSYCFDSISYFLAENRQQAMVVLAFLNSSLCEWRFRLTSTNNHVSTAEVAALPIYRFAFTTPPTERAARVAEARRLYDAGDDAAVLAWVDAARPAAADTVHDLLAHLAEQMLALNAAKQTETRGFLTWLGREVGAPVATLSNKTALENYLGDYQKGEPHAELATLLAALKQNRRKLAVDPAARAFQERLETEYAASLARLLPLKARLAATDRLIDRIVYRLYALTPAEIAIVEAPAG